MVILNYSQVKHFQYSIIISYSLNQSTGVKTSDNKYTTPVIALHMYTKEQKVTTQTKTTFNAPTSKTGRQNSFVPHSAPSSSTNLDKQEKEEKVRCIPIEDIISIEYSTEVKKEYATFETKQERQRSPKAKLGCWGLFQQCLREKCSCCCCPDCICDCCPTCMHNCCKTPPDEAPKYDTNTRRHVTANRMILIEMKCIQHSNIDIPTHVNVLPTDEKHKFYTENFNVDPIYFYLVNNTEPDQNDFQKKSSEAERFIRVVVQLRKMVVFSSLFFLFI
jgi:hypothetical protein